MDVVMAGHPLLRHPGAAALAAFVITVGALPLVRRLAVRFELYDRPDAGLKPHARPIPYLGGVGIWIGWLAVLLYGMTQAEGGHWLLASVAVGGALLLLVGLIDDIRHLPPGVRLAAQAAVAVVLLGGGLGRGVWFSLAEPVAPGWATMSMGPAVFLSGVFCILVLVGATNSTNLIDGLDGLCAGSLAIVAAGFTALALLLADTGEAHISLLLAVIISTAVLGACLAFLCFNFPPASMFMGDSGSLLLGFNVAVLMILITQAGSWRGLVGSAFIFGFPMFDTALAIVRRSLNGRPLFVGDRSHFYDQLRDRGLTTRQTIAACYGLGVLFVGCGLGCAVLPMVGVVALVVAGPLVAAFACSRFGLLRVDDAAERSGRRAGQGPQP